MSVRIRPPAPANIRKGGIRMDKDFKYEKEDLEEVCKNSYKLSQVLHHYNLDLGGTQYRKLREAITKFQIDISHFDSGVSYSREELEKACASSASYAEVLRQFGQSYSGSGYRRLKQAIEYYKIDISHFLGAGWHGENPEYTSDELFTLRDSAVSNSTLKKRIIKENLIEYKCAKCGNKGMWLDKELSLELHHKDGNRLNNNIDNLEFLCPNCHHITDNYGKKNYKK